ncbi:hypothetical protein [Pseudoalteromonas luteoviolacea]|nr:hypothetical protein [Pseudoalteromonas luteoviolacea]AOT10971.1 hypothetical protein S4054249_24335 [Pseudoalteromonas luteoviolacea]AOT15865.1 hypothetical protein S40542_24175 [Pseudoalteromonas luteoviolacea]AOT20792.1 hypothetical protein S4054_24255 [Pseudoalteromonas luteoviolacea]
MNVKKVGSPSSESLSKKERRRREFEKEKANAPSHMRAAYDELERRRKNRDKYYAQGVVYEELSKDHLHHQTYEQRLAKAAQLNGCEFKEAKPFKKPFSSREHHGTDNHIGWCDGQIVGIRRAPFWGGFCFLWFILCVYMLFFSVVNIVFFWNFSYAYLIPVSILGPVAVHKIWEWGAWIDKIEFNRHTGLVRMPFSFLRRRFYVPIEDIELCEGPVVQAARGGGEMATGSLVLTKYPKRYWFRPTITVFGGMEQEHWASIVRFMDISQPIHEDIHRTIEDHFRDNKNAMGTGPFPESMKKYLDAEDKQVNRRDVW